MNTIEFRVQEDKDEEVLPWINLGSRFTDQLPHLLNSEEVCITDDSTIIYFDYPLTNSCELIIGQRGLTRAQIASAIRNKYVEIYEMEKKTSNLPEETISERYPGSLLLNRAETNGIYGIWGHMLDDLCLSGMKKRRDGKWELLIDS
jgi:hypothetical protein